DETVPTRPHRGRAGVLLRAPRVPRGGAAPLLLSAARRGRGTGPPTRASLFMDAVCVEDVDLTRWWGAWTTSVAAAARRGRQGRGAAVTPPSGVNRSAGRRGRTRGEPIHPRRPRGERATRLLRRPRRAPCSARR